MKKVIALCACLLGFLSTSAIVTYTKSNGGWFGYKHVEQQTWNNGDSHLHCVDPGWTRCRVTSVNMILPSGEVIVFDENLMNTIDAVVMRSVTESNPNGNFIYDNKLFVRYKYNVDKNKLKVEVMTLDEARAEGYNV